MNKNNCCIPDSSKKLTRLLVSMILLFCFLFLPFAETDATSDQGERLLFIWPEGWQLAHSAREGKLQLAEYVPSGQTVKAWQEMITVQIFYGMGHIDPVHFLTRIKTYARRACNNVEARKIAMPATNGYRSIGMLQYCTHNRQTGQGEVTIFKAIQGKDSLYMVQKAWRIAPFTTTKGAEIAGTSLNYWIKYLSKISVSDTRENTCPNGIGSEPETDNKGI